MCLDQSTALGSLLTTAPLTLHPCLPVCRACLGPQLRHPPRHLWAAPPPPLLPHPRRSRTWALSLAALLVAAWAAWWCWAQPRTSCCARRAPPTPPTRLATPHTLRSQVRLGRQGSLLWRNFCATPCKGQTLRAAAPRHTCAGTTATVTVPKGAPAKAGLELEEVGLGQLTCPAPLQLSGRTFAKSDCPPPPMIPLCRWWSRRERLVALAAAMLPPSKRTAPAERSLGTQSTEM